MHCICSNYGCTQTFFYIIESNLHYTRFITLAVVGYQSAVTSAGARPRGLQRLGNAAPKKRCSGGELLVIVRPIRPAWELNPESSASIATSLTLRYNRPVCGKIIKI